MTREVRYRCLRCTHTFVVEIMDPDEARQEHVRLVPVKCPKCASEAVVQEGKEAL